MLSKEGLKGTFFRGYFVTSVYSETSRFTFFLLLVLFCIQRGYDEADKSRAVADRKSAMALLVERRSLRQARGSDHPRSIIYYCLLDVN